MIEVSNVNFECIRCGKCCKHRGDLALTPMDVFQISKFLRISCEEMVWKYTTLSHKHDFPQPLIQGKGSQNTCIFYQSNECLIYPVRPAQCYLFPLVALTPLLPFENEKFAIRIDGGCCNFHGTSKNIGVLDWIRNASTRYQDEKSIFIWFLHQIPKIEYLCRSNKKQFDMVKKIMYCQYDLSGDMESQIKSNIARLFA